MVLTVQLHQLDELWGDALYLYIWCAYSAKGCPEEPMGIFRQANLPPDITKKLHWEFGTEIGSGKGSCNVINNVRDLIFQFANDFNVRERSMEFISSNYMGGCYLHDRS